MTIERPKNAKAYRADSAAPRLANAFEIRNATDAGAEIWLTGEVGWDMMASDVIPQLQALDGEGKTLTVYLNSPGGDVFEGYAIGNFLAQMKATVNVRIMAMAASIATFISSQASSVSMPSNAMFMIHEAQGLAWGRASEHRNLADLLDKLNDQLAASYVAKRVRTLGSADGDDFRQMMAAGDAWLTAEDAAALGLIDEISDVVQVQACFRPDILASLNAPEDVIATLAQTEVEADTSADDEAAKAAADAEAQAAIEAAAQAEADAAAAAAAELKAQTQAAAEEIRAACKLMNMSEKADGFITAKASLGDVRTALFKARAEADAKTAVDGRQTDQSAPQNPAVASMHMARQKAVAALRKQGISNQKTNS